MPAQKTAVMVPATRTLKRHTGSSVARGRGARGLLRGTPASGGVKTDGKKFWMTNKPPHPRSAFPSVLAVGFGCARCGSIDGVPSRLGDGRGNGLPYGGTGGPKGRFLRSKDEGWYNGLGER